MSSRTSARSTAHSGHDRAQTSPNPASVRRSKTLEFGANHDADDDGGLYGIDREEPGPRRGGGWMVNLSRRGRRIARLFKDSVHGSSDSALAQARLYREAVIAALPPRTNREQAVKLRKSNTSGISGVGRGDGPRSGYWYATLLTAAGQKTRRFAVADHGEDRAKTLAIAQRRQWLADLPPKFLAHHAHAAEVTQARFGGVLDHEVDVYQEEALTRAEFDARLAGINARFDAVRPQRLRVRVKQYTENALSVAISDAGRPARRSLAQVYIRESGLPEALAEAFDRIAETVTALYGPDVGNWFMRKHGEGLLNPRSFDAKVGFNVLVWISAATLANKD